MATNWKPQEMGIEDFVQKKKLVSVIGLGYVGLPLALVLANNWLEKCRNEIHVGAVFILAFGNLAMVISILARYYA